METKEHWEKIYKTKQPEEVSWTQKIPETSLKLIHSFNLSRSSAIIDIGGGDSRLVDCLLDEGFDDITVLDISESALERAKVRLGEESKKVKWIVADITRFVPQRKYTVWHDRAAFHFLTTPESVKKYIDIAMQATAGGGFAVIGTFSERGPDKCSGLKIKKYSEDLLQAQLKTGFEKLKCFTEDHVTPFGSIQNFLFCGFRRIK